ncbi:unnamed protein product [Polarella glacialis]|uniref:Ubiquitin-like domain-containing protein n=1 Tax=Polarella glacialis TaxID=89957 RepID=A0A813GSD7_POLGL|nr:unnamed protein product [Polarella glacialis]
MVLCSHPVGTALRPHDHNAFHGRIVIMLPGTCLYYDCAAMHGNDWHCWAAAVGPMLNYGIWVHDNIKICWRLIMADAFNLLVQVARAEHVSKTYRLGLPGHCKVAEQLCRELGMQRDAHHDGGLLLLFNGNPLQGRQTLGDAGVQSGDEVMYFWGEGGAAAA